MKTKYKSLYKITLSLAIFLFLMNFLIDNPYLHGLIRIFINEKLEKTSGLRVDYKSINLSLLPIQADLFNFSVYNKSDTEKIFLSADKTTVRVSFSDLIMGKFLLSKVELAGLHIDFREDWVSDLLLSLKDKSAETQTPEDETLTWPPPWELPVQRLVIQNASFRHHIALQPDDSISMVLRGISGELNYDSWTEMQVKLALEDATITRNSKAFIKNGLIRLSGDWNQKSLLLHQFDIRSEDHQLQLQGRIDLLTSTKSTPSKGLALSKGTVDLPSHLEVHAQAKGFADLEVLGAALDLNNTKGKVVIHQSAVDLTLPLSENQKLSLLVNADVESQGAQIDDFLLLDSRASLQISQEQLEFLDVQLKSGADQHGKATGYIKFNEKIDMEFKAQLSNLPLSRLLGALTVEDFSAFHGDLNTNNLHLVATGDPFQMSVKADTSLSAISIPATEAWQQPKDQSPRCTFALDLDINSERLLFPPTKGNCTHPMGAPLTGEPSHLEIAGPIFFSEQGMDLKIDGQINSQVATYLFGQRTQGMLTSHVRIHGRYDHLRIDAKVQSTSIQWQDIAIQQLQGDFSYDTQSSTISWKNLTTTGDHLQLSSTGNLFASGDLPFESRTKVARASNTFVSKIVSHLPASLGLPAIAFSLEDSQIDYKGYLAQFFNADASLQIHLREASIDQERIANEIKLKAKAKKGSWTLEELVWSIPGAVINANGTHKSQCPRGGAPLTSALKHSFLPGLCNKDSLHFDLKVSKDGKKRPTALLSTLPWVHSVFKPIALDGNLELAVQLRGELENPQVALDGELSDLTIFRSKLAPIVLRGFFREGRLSQHLTQKGDAFVGRVDIDFNQEGLPFEWFLNFKRFDLRALAMTPFASDPRNYAYFSGSWEWRGKFSQWWQAKGKMSIEEIWVQYIGEIAGQSRPVNLHMTEPMVIVADGENWELLQGEGINLDSDLIKLAIYPTRLSPPNILEVRAEAHIDMRIVSLVSDAFESASGKIHVTVEASGSFQDPKFLVHFTDVKKTQYNAGTWEPLNIGIADLRPPLQEIQLDASYSAGLFKIKKFNAQKGGGTLNVAGSVNLGEAEALATDLTIAFKDIKLIYPIAVFKSFETQASGNLLLSGTGLPLKMRGNFDIVRARSTREFDIRSEIIEALKNRKYTKAGSVGQQYLDIDIQVRANESVQIANRNLQVTLSSDLQIVGSEQRPIVFGQIEIVRGKIVYKRDFNLTRGIISFTDPIKPDPSLDISAVAEISPYRVFLSVTGEASNPAVDLSIEPSSRPDGGVITKMDILTLISRGRLPETSSVTQDTSTSDAVSSEVFNIFVSQFEEPVEKILSLSGQDVVNQVYLESYTSDEDGSQGLRFSLPFNLTRDWDLILRNDVPLSSAASTKWSLSSEYSVTDSVYLQGNVDHATQKQNAENVQVGGSVDLKFRFGFQ